MIDSLVILLGGYDEENHVAEFEIVKIIMEKGNQMGGKDFFSGGDGMTNACANNVQNIKTTVVVSLPLQCNFRWNVLHAGGPLPSPPPRLGCARQCGLGYLWYEGQVTCVKRH